jgi:hypothetical protein
MNTNQAGKGDKPRPIKKEVFDNNFEQIVWNNNKERTNSVTKKGKITYKY